MKKVIYAAAAFVALASCNRIVIENSPAEGYGYINLGVTTDTEMVVAKGITNEDTDALAGYNFVLTKKDAAEEVWSKEYGAIVDSDWKVSAGSYTVYVENLTDAEAHPNNGIGSVLISGSADVTVSAGISSSCTVNCTPQNSKVTFAYSGDFDVVFDSPSVSVKETEERTLDMTVGSEHNVSNEAYFRAGSTLEWNLTAKLGGVDKNYQGSFTTQKAKWTQVTFTTGSTDGQIKVTITVDGEIKETFTVTATIDPITGDITQEDQNSENTEIGL